MASPTSSSPGGGSPSPSGNEDHIRQKPCKSSAVSSPAPFPPPQRNYITLSSGQLGFTSLPELSIPTAQTAGEKDVSDTVSFRDV
ncbi:hypothetical protein ANANG_G00140820, partial [Anguilla anguilla]